MFRFEDGVQIGGGDWKEPETGVVFQAASGKDGLVSELFTFLKSLVNEARADALFLAIATDTERSEDTRRNVRKLNKFYGAEDYVPDYRVVIFSDQADIGFILLAKFFNKGSLSLAGPIGFVEYVNGEIADGSDIRRCFRAYFDIDHVVTSGGLTMIA
jgi:hypothetical protein